MKKLIGIILLTILFIPTVYASGTTPDTSSSILVLFMDLTNILWLPFAFIAGNLLNNDFVYGTFLGVDKVLWNMWQINRTVANLILGVVFFIFIFMSFFSSEKGSKAIKELPKIVIAALLINFSFFLLGILIDISSILIGVVGSFPQTLVSDDTNNKTDVRVCKELKYASKIDGDAREFLECKQRTVTNVKDYLKGIANASGLLVYLSSSIMHIEQISNVPGGASMNLKNMTVSTALKVITSLLFIIPLVILIIINIIRIIRIWIYVAFAPLIALDIVFGNKVTEKAFEKQPFSISNIIGMIFQPVLVVASLSLVVIFTTTLQVAFRDSESEGMKQLGIVQNENGVSMMYGDEEKPKNLLTIVGNIGTKDPMKHGLGQIIISLIGVMFMWGLIKASFKFVEMTKGVSEGLLTFSQEAAKAVPIVGGVGYGALQKTFEQKVIHKGYSNKAASQASPITNYLDKALGLDKGDISLQRQTYLSSQAKKKTEASGILGLVEELIKEGVKQGATPATSPHFKKTYFYILQELYKKPGFKGLLPKGKKDWSEVTAEEYLNNVNNDGTALLLGVAEEYKRTGIMPDISQYQQLERMREYIVAGRSASPNRPLGTLK